jgi:hypothetical protein
MSAIGGRRYSRSRSRIRRAARLRRLDPRPYRIEHRRRCAYCRLVDRGYDSADGDFYCNPCWDWWLDQGFGHEEWLPRRWRVPETPR